MEFNEKKLTKIMIVASVVIALVAGGLVYNTHRVNAKEAIAKQALIASIDKQQDLGEAAKQAKVDAPVIDEANPARIIPKGEPVVAQSIIPPAPTQATPQTTQATQPATVKEIPQQAPAPLPTVSTVIPAPPVKQEPVPAITSIDESDIQRLQAYKQYKTVGGKLSDCFIDFSQMYSSGENMKDCIWLMKAFSPISLSDYYGMKAEWLTSPKLVYTDAIGDYCVRGVLTLTAYSDNKLGLTPNVKYQSDVEYRLDNSVQTGKVTLSLHSKHYLSDFVSVK